jgi:hypothetical protein
MQNIVVYGQVMLTYNKLNHCKYGIDPSIWLFRGLFSSLNLAIWLFFSFNSVTSISTKFSCGVSPLLPKYISGAIGYLW